VLQLGVDYQGGQEDLFRCVKMRVELGREWQRGANEFKYVASFQTITPTCMTIAFPVCLCRSRRYISRICLGSSVGSQR
jgi:hypothetical protein